MTTKYYLCLLRNPSLLLYHTNIYNKRKGKFVEVIIHLAIYNDTTSYQKAINELQTQNKIFKISFIIMIYII